MRPTKFDFGIRATPRNNFGRFRTSRTVFGSFCQNDAVNFEFRVVGLLASSGLMSGDILPIRFVPTCRSDSPAPPTAFQHKINPQP